MSYKLPLALLALVFVMLPGCRQPAGLPDNDVHAASITVYCYLADLGGTSSTGHLDLYAGFSTPDSSIESIVPIIRRGYHNEDRPYPRQIGFAVFGVPEFDGSTGVVVCTLNYYQSAHSGTPDLELRDAGVPQAGYFSAEDLYWGIWGSNVIMATDITHNQDGWCKVALDSAGIATIISIGAQGGGPLYTGWVYDGTTSDIYTEVYGADSGYEPFIKVVVTN